eukprot:Pompholyxophrys_punicea_v1_NODE_250_length_2534_cov_2.806374.p2 type:complete len:148 gc:universal NODE_250_length_2534_cov_2.806374:1524-1081(-)
MKQREEQVHQSHVQRPDQGHPTALPPDVIQAIIVLLGGVITTQATLWTTTLFISFGSWSGDRYGSWKFASSTNTKETFAYPECGFGDCVRIKVGFLDVPLAILRNYRKIGNEMYWITSSESLTFVFYIASLLLSLSISTTLQFILFS